MDGTASPNKDWMGSSEGKKGVNRRKLQEIVCIILTLGERQRKEAQSPFQCYNTRGWVNKSSSGGLSRVTSGMV